MLGSFRNGVETLEYFKTIFEEKYWSESTQSKIRRKTPTGKYISCGRMCRSKY